MTELLLRGGLPWGAPGPADILIRDGRIQRIDAPTGASEGADVIDASGLVVLPGLVDAHCHLDKTLWGAPWVPHSAGRTLPEKIDNGHRRRAELAIPSADNAAALLERMIVSGTAHVRTHTDVDPEIGLGGVEAIAEAARRHAGRVDVEQVAFPQAGILIKPGTAALMEEAVKAGVTTLGGLDPAGVDRDPVRHLDVIFDLAERYGAMIDIHLHDPGELGAWEFELIIERTRATGLAGRVTISHAFAIGQLPRDRQERLAEGLAEAGVGLTTCAIFDDAVPPVKPLRAAGVRVSLGNDGIRDLWTPYGDGDMLRRAMHLAYRSKFMRDEDIEIALDAATYQGARALGLPAAGPGAYGLAEGAAADLVLVRADSPAHAVMDVAPREVVIKSGRVVARAGTLT